MTDFTEVSNALKLTTTTIGTELIETCNARAIWEFVESKQNFADWIKNRISKYGFIEGQDFTVHKFMIGKASAFDYHCTTAMAKELGMVEANEKGKLVRQYFIECEKLAKEAQQELTPLEMMAQQLAHLIKIDKAQKLLALEHAAFKNTQISHDASIKKLEQDVKELNPHPGFYTIVAWVNHLGLKADITKAADLGKKATAYCTQLGITPGKFSHAGFYTVNTYPVEVLNFIFKKYF